MKTQERKELVARLVEQAREYDRRGDVTLRNQTIRSIEESAPSVAYAKKAVKQIMGK